MVHGNKKSENSDCNGYIVKFYRITDRDSFDETVNFDFYCWGWFDRIRIIKVSQLDEYQTKSLALDDIDLLDKECNRQKLLLYKHQTETGSILNINELKHLPLVSISIVNFTNGSNDIEPFDAYLKKVYSNKFKSDDFNFEIFGVLSANSCVVVCRSNNYFNVNKFILAIRQFRQTCGIYTVLGISSIIDDVKLNWKETRELRVSIQLSLKPSFDTSEISKYISSFDNPNINLDNCLLMGKKDCLVNYDIKNSIESIKEFIDFSFLNGFYNDYKNEKTPVLSSSTSFSYDYKSLINCHFRDFNNELEFEDDVDDHSSLAQKYFDVWNDIIDSKIKMHLSTDFVFEMKRLVLRAYQLLCESQRSSAISTDIIEGINGFLILTTNVANIISKDAGEGNGHSYFLPTIIQGILSLNTLLDNREINEFHDFETPRSNIIFTGNSFKLIKLYSVYSRDVLLLLSRWNIITNKKDSKKNFFYLTTDGYSKVTIERHFVSSNEYRLINVRVPTELLYTPYYTMCMIAHELGHFSKIGWDRKVRNRYFTLSAIYAFFSNLTVRPNVSLNPQTFIENFYNNYDNVSAFDKSFKDFIDKFEKDLSRTCSNLVVDKSKTIGDFLSNFSSAINIIQDAFRESPADLFMIRTLQISDPIDFLDIAVNYFMHMGYNCSKLGKNIVLRLVAVLYCMHIKATDSNIPRNFESFKKDMQNLLNNIADKSYNKDSIIKTCTCIMECIEKEYFYYICMPLLDFLCREVYVGMNAKSDEVLSEFNVYVDYIKGKNNDVNNVVELLNAIKDRYKDVS